jgi:PhnB protein
LFTLWHLEVSTKFITYFNAKKMLAFNPYLNFPGTTEAAFNFYRSVFGGEFVVVMRFQDTDEGAKLPENERNKIMHISLPLGEGTILMGTDALESMGQHLTVGTNFSISINAGSRQEADDVFATLSENGKVEMPMTDMFWGDYFGMFKDKFDIQWMVSFNEKFAGGQQQ